ncbi:MAG TPA: extracellular solute-binding protein, partial [Ktedonobacteraceae bacterium]
MNAQHYLRRAYLLMLLPLLLPLLLAACGSARDAHNIVFWTTVNDDIDMAAQKQIVAEFEKANPDLHVDLVSAPAQFTGDATSLITAVRGGTAPDVYLIDRFTVSQFAAIGLLTDLSPIIAKNDPTLPTQYLPFATQEASYQGDLYALPMDTDARAVFYNKDLLRQAGIDPSVLDPSKGPMSVDEMMQLGLKMDKTGAQGNYTELGIVPWDGQGFHATWGLAFGAKYFNPQTCQVTPTEPGFTKAFQSFAQWAKELNYAKVSTFDATYQPPNAPPSQTPFLTGHLGMMISGNWDIASLQEYAPKLNYGLTYLPVANKGDKPFTWSGGFGLVMPTGAANSVGGYRFMKFMSGP